MRQRIITVLNGRRADSAEQAVEAREQAAEAIIEGSRYRDRVDEVLARYEQVDTVMVSFGELQQRGLDVFVVARALVLGKLNPVLFGRALEAGLTSEGFSELLMGLKVNVCYRSAPIHLADINDLLMGLKVNADELSGALQHFIEAAQERALHPDPVDRIMHHLGECGCRS